MAINFPPIPAINEIYTYNGRSWQWNGTVWNIVDNTSPTYSNISATNVNATNVITTNLTTTNSTITNSTITNATITNIVGNASSSAVPTSDNHITNKKYVDTRAIAFSIGLS